MERAIMATEAVRKFSELLNTIKFKGEHYIIERGGKPVAYMGPIDGVMKTRALRDLKNIIKTLPRLGDEIDSFSSNIEEIVKSQPSLPKALKWE